MAACFLQVGWGESGGYGEFRGSKELVKLEEFNSDIGNHLSRCHLSREVFKTQLLRDDVTNTPRSYFGFKDRKYRLLFT